MPSKTEVINQPQEQSCCDSTCCSEPSSLNSDSTKNEVTNVDPSSVKGRSKEEISNAVHSRYSDIAQTLLVKNVTKSGYNNACCSPDEIALENIQEKNDGDLNIPSLGSDKKLLKFTEPKMGETVVDFGSGPGKDLLTIAKSLNDDGKFIGIDFSEKMIEVATQNTEQLGLKNVSFIQSSLEDIRINDNTGDLIISNCVINLVPDKNKVFKEAYRILKPGGRIVFSDYVLDQDLDEQNVSVQSYCGCFGNNTKQYYIQGLKNAGFDNIATHLEYSVPQTMGTQTVTYHSTIFIAYK